VIPVRDVARARAFYLLPSTDYPGTAAWPIASFLADDLRAVTTDLRRRGVRLESFDEGPNKTDADGIAHMGALLIAWFRDPDDNIISLYQPT
jgi:catechol 2,3-dioxygenase-like lactoylglutathione lyase family enzyme